MADENRISVELVVTPKGLELFDTAGKKIGEFSNATGKASGVIKDALEGVADGFGEELKAVERAISGHKKLESSFSELGASIISINQAWDLASRAAQSAGAVMETALFGVTEAARAFREATIHGISTGFLTELSTVAKTAGRDMEDVLDLVRDVRERVGEATTALARGELTNTFLDAFNRLGAGPEVLKKFANDTEAAVEFVIGKIEEAQHDPRIQFTIQELTNAGFEKFGPVVAALGEQGLSEVRDKVRQLGLAIDDETARLAAQTEVNLGLVGQAFDGVLLQLTAGAAPALEVAASKLVDFVSEMGIADGRLKEFGRVIGSVVADGIETLIQLLERLSIAAHEGRFADQLLTELQKIGPAVEPHAKELGVKIGGWIVDGVKIGIQGLFTIDWSKLREAAKDLAGFEDPFKQWAEQNRSIQARAFDVDIAPLTTSVTSVAGAFDSLRQAEAEAAAQTVASNNAFSSTHEVVGQLADGTYVLGKSLIESGEAGKKAGSGYRAGAAGANEAAKAAEQLAKAFGQTVTGILGSIEATEDQSRALQEIIDRNLSAEDAQVLLNDALERAAVASALAKDSDQSRAEVIGQLTRALTEEQQAQAALNATRAAQIEGNNLQQEIAILQQVIAGTKERAAAEREIAILKETQKGVSQAEAERVVDLRNEYAKLTDTLDDVGNKGVEVGALIGDAFSQTLDGLIAGTLDFGKVWESFTISMGKQLFENLWNEKLNFDEGFKFNILDLVDWVGGVFSGGTVDIGGLFSFGGATGGGGGSGGGFLSLLTGGGGLGSAGWLFSAIGGGVGAGGAYGSAGTLTGIGANLLWQGAGQAFLSNMGQDALALLGGETFASTVGNWAGNSGWFNPTWGGQAFGGASVAGSLGGGVLGSIGSAGIYAGLGIGASYAGQATAGALGIRPLYGTEGQIHMAIGNTVAQIIGNYFGGPLGGFVLQYLNEILQPLLFDALGIAQPPTMGTLRRRQGESMLDALPTFQTLQEQYGDLTRKRYRLSDNPQLLEQREALGEETLRDIGGFAAIFAQLGFGDIENGGKVAGITEQWTNILTDFFSRMDTESEETGLAIRQHLAQAFRELGVDAADAMGIVNELANSLLFTGGATQLDYFGEDVSNVTNLGEAVRGTAAIFESELPAGVHIAALALETMSKDGVTFFGDLDRQGHDTLVALTEDAENFDKVLAHLFEEGFEIDAESFRQRLKDIVASAQELNSSIGGLFSSGTFQAGFNNILVSLKSTIQQTLGSNFIEQLFGGTNFAAVFEPVFNVLNRIDEFDLTTATGAESFTAALLPALAEGRANLEEYLPVLREMYENWKEIEEEIDEALAPTKAEQMAAAIESAFSGLGGLIGEAIDAGVAVLNAGGSLDEATRAFNQRFGAGLQTTLKTAVFNAVLDTAIIQPLIARYQPAFAFVAAAGLALGFSDPRVIEAWNDLMADIQADVANMGPLLLTAAANTDDLDKGLTRFFTRMQADIDQINRDLASSMSGAITGAITEAMRSGKAIDLSELAENLHMTIYESVVAAMVEAMVSAAVIEGGLAPMLEQLRVLSAAAWEDGVLDAGEKNQIAALVRQIGESGIELANVMIAGLEPILELIGGLPGVEVKGKGKKKGHYETRNGDIYFVEDGGEKRNDSPRIEKDAHGRSFGGSVVDPGEGRQIVEETVKPPAEQFSDTITDLVIPGLRKFDDSIEDVTTALARLERALRGGGSAPDTSSSPSPDDGPGSGVGLDLDGRQPTGGSGGRRNPIGGGKAVHGHADGGSFTLGQEGLFIVGEEGPELFVARPGGYDVIPLSPGAAAAMLGGGVIGYADGTRKRGGIDAPPPAPPPPDPGPRPRIHPENERPRGTYYPGGFGPRGGGVGWGGSPFVGPDDLRNPANNPRNQPSRVDVEIDIDIDDAVEEFLRGGSLSDFEKALTKGAREGVIDGLIEGMLESGPIKKAIDAFNAQMSAQVEKAMKDGIITAEEQAELDALATKLEGNIETAAKQMAPVVESVGKALGIGIESSTKEAIDGFSGNLEGVLKAFFEGGDMEDVEKALNQMVYDAFTSGIIQALLTTGPLGKLIEEFGSEFSEAFATAMEDGVLTAEEEGALRELALGFGEDMGKAIEVLGPVYGPMFQKWAEDFGISLTNNVADLDQVLGGAIRSALMNGDSFATFSKNVRQALYESIVDGLVRAFIDSAVINGLLAVPLGIINETFRKIGEGQISIADANVIILEQLGAIGGLLNSPEFKAVWDTVIKGAKSVRDILGITLDTAQDIGVGFADVADEAKNACAGECEWERRLVEQREKNAALGEEGRSGFEIEEYETFKKKNAADDDPWSKIPDTTKKEDGSYGWLGSDADWRRHNRWNRRQRKNDGKPGYYGTGYRNGAPDTPAPPPPDQKDEEDPWFYDPDIPWNDDVPHMAAGGIVTRPTFALIGEAGPEAVIPLGSSKSSGPILVQDPEVAAMRRELAELREAILNRPVVLDGREISKSTRRHEQRERRGGQSDPYRTI